jgi:hypothetical protein
LEIRCIPESTHLSGQDHEDKTVSQLRQGLDQSVPQLVGMSLFKHSVECVADNEIMVDPCI